MNAPEDVRAGLVRELAAIARAVARAPADRCPYRTRTDQCTFEGPCRNRRQGVCNGAILNSEPPT